MRYLFVLDHFKFSNFQKMAIFGPFKSYRRGGQEKHLQVGAYPPLDPPPIEYMSAIYSMVTLIAQSRNMGKSSGVNFIITYVACFCIVPLGMVSSLNLASLYLVHSWHSCSSCKDDFEDIRLKIQYCNNVKKSNNSIRSNCSLLI